MIKKRNILWLSLALLHSEVILAKPEHNVHRLNPLPNYFHDMRPFATFTAGSDFIQASHAKTLSLLPPASNHYTSTSSWQSSANLGLAAGVENALNDHLSYQLAIAGYFNTQIHPQGHVWQFALPDFDNFIYRYDIQSSRLMVTGKFSSTIKQNLHPYLSAELGTAFNHAKNYNETPLADEEIAMEPFRNHTSTSFSWGIGAGIDYAINANIRIGAGYQFANLGKFSLGTSPAQLTKETLGCSHLYSHQVRFQLTTFI